MPFPTVVTVAVGIALALVLIAALVVVTRHKPAAKVAGTCEPAPRQTAAFVGPDVFISYPRSQRSQVAAIADRLRALKLTVWFDAQLSSGSAFDAEIERNVRTAKAVVVCWTPDAVQSDWVRAEAAIGRQRGVLVAVLLDQCDLPPPFNLVHANDLTDGIEPRNVEWLKVLERIGALVGRPGLATYEALEDKGSKGTIKTWIDANRTDALVEDAKLRLADADPMNVGLVVNAGGRLCLVHDKPFEATPLWVGYHVDKKQIEITFDTGKTYLINWTATPEMDSCLVNTNKILVIRMLNKEPVEGYDTSFLKLEKGRVIEPPDTESASRLVSNPVSEPQGDTPVQF